ncbi:mandelate racemase/muconate lactonizing enzyme family protein [uncultured Pseudacidovorax sp.]|uniref:mandelate racemase/muconate lactonizing enzyme family protein n=1 Tax=uncultured Pseudacidovorax sp. TaxID=679313 RepID=UPI0025DEA11E|nr:mandelate racemase/muconate lactonizing enzyme family protein [uncultured Pseudacidovorax sp.]
MRAAATELRLERIEAFVFRAPADPPVQTSFGIMRDRPALLLRAIADDGAEGWGEVWCNFPTVGAEHRARMALTYLPPLACGPQWTSPQHCFETLGAKLAVLAIQCGEPGPLAQIVAGLDIALWDLLGRRHGLPVWKLLAPDLAAPAPVPLYASGLNPTAPEKLAEAKRAEGYRAFKLKVGFGAERDEANLAALREVIGPAAPLMVDANQAWDLDEAIAAGRRMARHDLGWLEEPVRADTPLADWARLAREQPLPLAGGENLAGLDAFDAHIGAEGLSIIQPDLGKWGGFSGCLAVGRRTLAQGKRFCPHWLGAGIGLTASFHLKAAVGGPGYVEVDANPNPLRDLLATPVFALEEGAVHLGTTPGLGVQPDLGAAQAFRIAL